MGVETNFYTVLGAKFEWDDDFYSLYEELEEAAPGLTINIIFDYMSGEYFVIGKELFDSGSARWGFEDGDTFNEYTLEELAQFEKEYKEEFSKLFPNFLHLIKDPFKIITFMHCS